MKQGTKDEITRAELDILKSNLVGVQSMCSATILRIDDEIERIDKILQRIEEPTTA